MDGFESRVLQGLRARINEEIAIKQAAIGEGTAADFAAYKRQTGEILGLKAALRIAQDIEDDAKGIQKGEKN